MMQELVSVIIPCFNKEKWLKQAIDSCLKQTYSQIEVIVIDDGSTDNSLEIIKSYGNKIIWETGQNRGANYARNRGFDLSSGAYIQYLDADDYLLQHKIQRQVRCLEQTEADIVYSDEKHIKYLRNGEIFTTDINLSRLSKDFLDLFLLCDVYIQTANPLFKRDIVANSGGWDETLKASQDVDFFRSIAINGARFTYLPGCYLIYRHYQSNDKITCNLYNVWNYRILAAEKIEKKLVQLNKLSDKYKKSLAYFYCTAALSGCIYFDYSQYLMLLKKVKTLDPSFRINSFRLKNGYTIYKIINQIFGFVLAGIIYKFFKDLINSILVKLTYAKTKNFLLSIAYLLYLFAAF